MLQPFLDAWNIIRKQEDAIARLYLIRHGQADYTGLEDRGFFGFGRAFAQLSEAGTLQAAAAAKDERLKTAQLIVSSPYTRALQTAQILSRETGLPVTVELDLHEWMPDRTNQLSSGAESAALAEEFCRHQGEHPQGQTMRWETLTHMRERMRRVADKYAEYDCVIFVGHGMAFRALHEIAQMAPAEIIECNYQPGDPDCTYHFT